MNIITIEFSEYDANRLLWLVQREATQGRIWDGYWASIAQHIQDNINLDAEIIAQVDYQETIATGGLPS